MGKRKKKKERKNGFIRWIDMNVNAISDFLDQRRDGPSSRPIFHPLKNEGSNRRFLSRDFQRFDSLIGSFCLEVDNLNRDSFQACFRATGQFELILKDVFIRFIVSQRVERRGATLKSELHTP